MKIITLNHGSGGTLTHKLINEIILSKLNHQTSPSLDDCGFFKTHLHSKLALTTDSYVVNPLFFPGGDIGKLAISGTLNDLSTSGANPLALTLSFIIEEGLPLLVLEKIMDSISFWSKKTNVPIITGDTKVVEKGKGDKIFINTAGVGVIEHQQIISSSNSQHNDIIMITGPIGNHEVCLMQERGVFNFETQILSDVAPLNLEIQKLLHQTTDIHTIKDPTRGGLASALYEICKNSKSQMTLEEEQIPIEEKTQGICELLGLDPLYMANEGRFIIIGSDSIKDFVVKNFPLAKVIGYVTKNKDENFPLLLKTKEGGLRKLGMLEISQHPRIC